MSIVIKPARGKDRTSRKKKQRKAPERVVVVKRRRAKMSYRPVLRPTPAPQQKGIAAEARRFAAAVNRPFSLMAFGARVVDAFSMPSVTYHVRGSIPCTSDPSGNFSAVILPSPCFSMVSITGIATAGTVFAQNNAGSYFVSPTGMVSVLPEYRCVGVGVRIVPVDTAFSSKGRYVIATVPTSRNAPSWNTMETVTAANTNTILNYTCGVDSTVSGWVNLPTAKVFSAQDLLRGEIEVTLVPSHVSFYEYKGSYDRSAMTWNTNQVIADEGVFNSTTGLVNATAGGRKDVASLAGGTALLLSASGLPNSTNEFVIEVIYHLEGTPRVVGLGSGALLPSAAQTVHGSTSLVEKVLSVAHQAGHMIRHVANAVAPGAAAAVQFGVGMARLASRQAVPRLTY